MLIGKVGVPVHMGTRNGTWNTVCYIIRNDNIRNHIWYIKCVISGISYISNGILDIYQTYKTIFELE